MIAAAFAFFVVVPAQLPPHFEDMRGLTQHPISTYIPVDIKVRSTTGALTLFMNRDGGAYQCAADDAARNLSSIACSDFDGEATMPAFAGDDADWHEIMSCLGDLFAPFALPVTDVEPAEGVEYVEAVISGGPNDAGMGNGVGGVAPYACGVIPGAVVYAFADVYGSDNRAICETAAQEIAHAFGLDHEFMCEDPMTYLLGCGDKAFVDEYVPCGEFEPRPCSCGEPTQNSVRAMLELFGDENGNRYQPPPDASPPTVEIVSPADGTQLPANSELTIVAEVRDDAVLTVVEIEWDFTGERMFCPATADLGGAYTCTRNGTTYTWKVDVGVGNRTFRAHARDIGGNEVTSPDVKLWFSPDGNGPPDDLGPPAIVLGAPLAGTIVAPDTPFDIVATVVDDVGLAKVELNWQRRGEDRWIPCPYEDERLTCTVVGNSYRWSILRTRDGRREFDLRAYDTVGNVTLVEERIVTIEPGGVDVVGDGNDALDEAAPLACGDSVTVATDVDWFVIDAPAGHSVSVSVEGEGAGAVVATDGKRILGSGRAVDVVAGDAALGVAVVPSNAIDGPVQVSVVCTEPAPPSTAPTCASGAPAGLVALLAALSRRRRRR